jgi:hypothetical protein
LQFHYKKAHGLNEDQFPKIEREVPYTLSAYSGGILKERDKLKKKASENENKALSEQQRKQAFGAQQNRFVYYAIKI